MSKKPAKKYTMGEEVFNSVSHGVGALLAVVGASVIVTLAACFGDARCILSCLVYGISLVILYTMSTLYHAFPFEKVKNIFRIFDHASIFILIAGSYTPCCLLALKGNPKGVIVAAVVWICAISGKTPFSSDKSEKPTRKISDTKIIPIRATRENNNRRHVSRSRNTKGEAKTTNTGAI